MFKITRLTLDGIGPFDHAEIELGEGTHDGGSLVLFEGPNGSGKTTIAQAIACIWNYAIELSWTLRPTVAPKLAAPGHALLAAPEHALARRARRHPGGVFAITRTTNFSVGISLSLRHTDPFLKASLKEPSSEAPSAVSPIALANSIPIHQFVFSAQGHEATPTMITEGPRELSVDSRHGALSFGRVSAADKFGQFLTNLESDRVRAKVYAAERPEGPEREELTQRAASLGRSLGRIEHALSRLTQRDVKITFPITQQAPRITFDGDEIPLDLLGEGLRSSVSWLADLLVRLERHPWTDLSRAPFEQPFVMILDEVDEGLHPSLQMVLLPTLRELFPHADIFATTHSPFVVASAAEGIVIPLRPDAQHRITGKIEGIPLRPGQTLSWVSEAVFGVPSGFIDEASRRALETHRAAVQTLRANGEPDWVAFREAREVLLSLNDETRSIVSYRELPVREKIQRGLAA